MTNSNADNSSTNGPTNVANHERESHLHDLGLAADLPRFANRRRALGLLGGAGALALLTACGGDSEGAAGSSTTAMSNGAQGADADAQCAVIDEETAGPYPGDGSNGPNVLTSSGVVRSDITTSFGSMSGTAEGSPLGIRFTVLDVANGCVPYAGAAVYVWHCDRDGGYSLYSRGATNQNYLRGVQEADANGTVNFSSIFPACYPGRWPHIHFEVYPSLSEATSASAKLATSQVALPEDICNEIYNNVEGYSSSVRTLAGVSLESDNVFSDGWSRELGTMSGSVGKDLLTSLTVPV